MKDAARPAIIRDSIPSLPTLALELAPLLFALVLVAYRLLVGFDSLATVGWLSAGALPLLFLVGAVRALRRDGPSGLLRLWRLPCLLAPLAVLYPWAVVPGHIGIGMADISSFVAYAKSHPGMRVDLVLGAGSVLGSGAMPALFALLVRHRRPGPVGRLGLFLLSLIPWVPVLVYLDLELLVTSLYLFPFYVLCAVGPLIRGLAVAGMLAGLVLGARPGPSGVG